jgi:hypothetical protein
MNRVYRLFISAVIPFSTPQLDAVQCADVVPHRRKEDKWKIGDENLANKFTSPHHCKSGQKPTSNFV